MKKLSAARARIGYQGVHSAQPRGVLTRDHSTVDSVLNTHSGGYADNHVHIVGDSL